MGLFHRKKPEVTPLQAATSLPEFPTFPGAEKGAPVEVKTQKIASYEPAIRPEDISRMQQAIREIPQNVPANTPLIPAAPLRIEVARPAAVQEPSLQRQPSFQAPAVAPEAVRAPFRQNFYEGDSGLRPVPQMINTQGRYEPLAQPVNYATNVDRMPVEPRNTVQEPRRQYAGREELLPGERPVFVKLDQYREVMGRVSELKERLRESEVVLARLDTLRKQEEQEMRFYREHLQALKERLLEIDKRLFEV